MAGAKYWDNPIEKWETTSDIFEQLGRDLVGMKEPQEPDSAFAVEFYEGVRRGQDVLFLRGVLGRGQGSHPQSPTIAYLFAFLTFLMGERGAAKQHITKFQGLAEELNSPALQASAAELRKNLAHLPSDYYPKGSTVGELLVYAKKSLPFLSA